MEGTSLPEIVLRPYQEKAKAHILACKDRGIERCLVVMPTGTGKTTLFSALIGEFSKNYDARSLVLAHRRELLDQAFRRIGDQNPGLEVEIEGSSRRVRRTPDAVVGSVQALGRPNSTRLSEFVPGLMIVDEAHHAAADTYQSVMRRFGCYEGGCFTVGVTATPHRLDNKPLHGDETAIFQEVAFAYTLREAIRDGWLADIKGYRVATGIDLSKVRISHGDYNARQLQEAVNTEARNEAAFDHWVEMASDRRTIVFCTGIEHAADVAALFRSRGYTAESVNGTMRPEEREGIMRRFRDGRTQILTNVDIATEGFDVPEAGCVLMLRPTQSWALFTQMIGRGLRVLPGVIDGVPDPTERRHRVASSGKPDCIVIDVVDNGTAPPVPRPEREEGAPEKPSLAAIVGLPPELDLNGHTVVDALEKWDKLDPSGQAYLFRRPTKFEDLGDTLTAVDLLAELSLPEELTAMSRNAWMKTGDGVYMLPCGSSSKEEHRLARLECDPLGRYHLTLSSDQRRPQTFDFGDDLRRAFQLADRQIKEIWPFTGGFTMSDTLWRKEPVTDYQRSELSQLGVEPAVVAMIETAGQAWSMIEMKRRERAAG